MLYLGMPEEFSYTESESMVISGDQTESQLGLKKFSIQRRAIRLPCFSRCFFAATAKLSDLSAKGIVSRISRDRARRERKSRSQGWHRNARLHSLPLQLLSSELSSRRNRRENAIGMPNAGHAWFHPQISALRFALARSLAFRWFRRKMFAEHRAGWNWVFR